MGIARFTPLTRSVTEWSTEFDSFENAENGLRHLQPNVEDYVEDDLPGQDPYEYEDEAFTIRPLSKWYLHRYLV